MLVIPAIDIRGGQCVRLVRGDFDRETVYDSDPVRVASLWMSLGAQLIHVVDLDGARRGTPCQLELVERMTALGAQVELGGGLRRLEDLRGALAAGVRRVVIGTAAVENELILRQGVREFGAESVVLGVDARDGRVATRGWSTVENMDALGVIKKGLDAGVERVVYTDIERDGTMTSPNFAAIEDVAALGVRVVASGGVSSHKHLRQLSTIPGVEAAIVGKALYEGRLRISTSTDWWITAIENGSSVGEDDGGQE